MSTLFLVTCTACAPKQAPEPYSLLLEKFADFTSDRYINPLYSYCAPNEKALYYFYYEGDASLITDHLAMIDLESGVGEDIYHFNERHNAALVPSVGLDQVEWVGNTLTFVLGEGVEKVTRYSYNTETQQMSEQQGLDAPPMMFYYEPDDERGKALMRYNLPEGAMIQHTTVVGETLYQTFTQGGKAYYRSLDLNSKKESTADITNMDCIFYGSFLLCKGSTPGTRDLYRFQGGKLACVTSQLPNTSPYLLIHDFNEFVITNSGFEKCFYVKDNVVNPLTVTAENPFQHITFKPEQKLEYIGCHGTTLYYYATENVDGMTYYYLLKGEIVPSIL